MFAAIQSLFAYPVKSCHGVEFERATLTERGLLHDREWMIVRSGGDPAPFVTQREIPELALIETALTEDSLILRAPRAGEERVRFDTNGPPRQVVVWRDTVSAIDQGDAIARWLSDFVGAEVRLVRFNPREKRTCNPQFAGDSGSHTQFADGYPVLVIGRQSLEDLNRRLGEKGIPALPMNRFRPNLVIDGLEPYDEDHVNELKFGEARLRLVKPCTRCQITTTDQATAKVGEEPLRTFASYRNNPRLAGVTFGVNAIVVGGAGVTLAVGDSAAIDWAF
jgi:MOSC domain-containing protein